LKLSRRLLIIDHLGIVEVNCHDCVELEVVLLLGESLDAWMRNNDGSATHIQSLVEEHSVDRQHFHV
jgi:hypothetical protein